MKVFFRYSIIAISALLFFTISCKKPAEHSIRIKNNSSLGFQTITIETSAIVFKDLKANTTSDYQAIPEGTYSLNGDFSSNTTFNISGKGVHKWSIIIENGGKLNVVDEGQ